MVAFFAALTLGLAMDTATVGTFLTVTARTIGPLAAMFAFDFLGASTVLEF
jgi:hypothetical protein